MRVLTWDLRDSRKPGTGNKMFNLLSIFPSCISVFSLDLRLENTDMS